MRKKTIANRAKILYLTHHLGIKSLRQLSKAMGYASLGGFLSTHQSLFDDGLMSREPYKQGTVQVTKNGLRELRNWGFLIYNDDKIEAFKVDDCFGPIL